MPSLVSSADDKYQHQLPTVSFRIIDDKELTLPAGVHSEQSRSYGYNDFSDFELPEHYIRYIEPIESELKSQVEYDMDEQDQAWLDAVNAERQKEQSGAISYEVFEILMDKLEKEWFELIKRIPQQSHMPVEDSTCAICDDGEGENSNAIVFCDGCNLAVHQDCYGVPYIPEGQWLCRKCTVSPENPVSCLFCPNEGGAFKQTSTGHWAHLLCAIYIPELGVGNAIYMEPVDGVEAIPKSRWKLHCSLCRERVGACIQCDNRSCFTAFHVTCARQMGLLQGMKALNGEAQLRAFCFKHLPPDMRATLDLDEEDTDYGTPAAPRKRPTMPQRPAVTTKNARAHAKSYRPAPPIVPHIIVQSLIDYVSKLSIRKRQPFIERLCRYWSLKREARRGAPLLKRLHLEPWTASAASKQQTEAEKETKLKFLTKLRNDLEKVRMLAEYVRKREKEKLRQSQLLRDVVDTFMFPNYGKLRLTLEKISAMDRQEVFLQPVNRAEVPDYFDVVKEPMCWLVIDDKIERRQYRNVSEFKHDIHLVLSNAMLYNKADTLFHRVAKRIETNAKPLLDELDQILEQSALVLPGVEDNEWPDDVGDLEPSRLLLQVLSSQVPNADPDSPPQDYLASLFAFEIETPKEPSPPPPSPPPTEKRKRETYAERKARREGIRAAAREQAPGRRTRASAIGVEDGADHIELGTSSTSRPSRVKTEGTDMPDADDHGVKRSERNQRGVAGIKTFEFVSDKERREREKALDPHLSHIDKEEEFRRFNVGWVLPEGSKRNRVTRQPLPPPKSSAPKKKKDDKDKSEQPKSEKSVEPVVEPLAPTEPSPAKIPAVANGKALALDRDTLESSLSPPPSDLTEPEEEPETPAPKSNKGAAKTPLSQSLVPSIASLTASARGKRKAESVEGEGPPVKRGRARPKRVNGTATPGLKEEKEQTEEVEEPSKTNGNGAKKTRAPEPHGEEVEEEVEERGKDSKTPSRREPRSGLSTPRSAPKRRAAQTKQEEKQEEEEEEDPYPHRMLVWAKFLSYPYFPAEVVDPTDPEVFVPDSVMKNRANIEKENRCAGQKTWLVRFFDAQDSYGWIPASRLDVLGTDDAIDQMYLDGKDASGKSRASKHRVQCRKAYRLALAQIADEEEEEVEEVEEKEA